jgi:glyoxylase-like metal-dependent hydrolase (beta-lactamase superfamily II)
LIDALQFEVRGIVVGLLQTNCWIIGSRQRGEAIVIDPGEQAADIAAVARDMGVKITRIIGSHAHFDHVMGAGDLQNIVGDLPPFLLHGNDEPLLQDVPGTSLRVVGKKIEVPPPPAEYLKDGDDLEIAGISLKVFHTPGHSPGSVAIYAPDAGLLFSGDTLFRESIGRTDFKYGDPQAIERSIRRLYELPPETRVQPGHGYETTIAHEIAHNPFVRPLRH